MPRVIPFAMVMQTFAKIQIKSEKLNPLESFFQNHTPILFRFPLSLLDKYHASKIAGQESCYSTALFVVDLVTA